MRRVLFWLHLATGVGAGAVILVLSVTGVLLAYERQILAWVEREQRSVAAPTDVERLPVETLLARVREARPEAKPMGLTVHADPARAAVVSLGREGVLFVDPGTGSVRGQGSTRARGFFRAVTDWHRWLGAGGEGREKARAVTGAANLAFLFMLLSGLCLWWPRTWSGALWFAGGLRGRARDFNWHNVAGFWSLVPLVLIVLSGVLLSYPWANDLLFRWTGSPPPPQRGAQGQRGEGGRPVTDGLDGLWARAERQVPDWRSLSVRFPSSADAPVSFSIDRGDGARPDLRAQLTLDPRTGAVVSFEPYAGQSTGRKVRAWARFLHTGEAGGIPGQTVAAVAASGAALLVWTGLALAWRRWRAWLASPTPSAETGDVTMIQEGGTR